MRADRVLVIATGNHGKLFEIKGILGDIPWLVSSLDNYPSIISPAETGSNYVENAKLKATYYASVVGHWVLADDSGLEVNALDGAPGLFSARYAGQGASDKDRRLLLLSELGRASGSDRSARFMCAVAVANPEGVIACTTEGSCNGKIIGEERGEGGFGYDPLFQPDGYEQTFAELSQETKNVISHRARALAAAREFLLRS